MAGGILIAFPSSVILYTVTYFVFKRTSGDIFRGQMKAFQEHVNIECVFITAPFSGSVLFILCL